MNMIPTIDPEVSRSLAQSAKNRNWVGDHLTRLVKDGAVLMISASRGQVVITIKRKRRKRDQVVTGYNIADALDEIEE